MSPRKFFAATALAVLSVAAEAQPEAAAHSDTGDYVAALFPYGDVIDFGEVPTGEQVEDTVWVRNPEPEPIVIENVRSSCGCTAVDWPADAIAPGELAAVPLVFTCRSGGFRSKHLDVWLSHLRRAERITVQADCVSPGSGGDR